MEEPKKMTEEEEADEIVRRLLKTKAERDREAQLKAIAEVRELLEEEMAREIARQIDDELLETLREIARRPPDLDNSSKIS